MTGQAKYALNYCPELKRTRLLHIMVMGEVPPRMVICHFRGGAGGRVWWAILKKHPDRYGGAFERYRESKTTFRIQRHLRHTLTR